MTVKNRDYLKENLPKWATMANLALLLGLIWYQAQWQQSIETRVEIIEEHTRNKDVHQNYKDMSDDFVPRAELQLSLNIIQATLLEIKQDIKKLEKK